MLAITTSVFCFWFLVPWSSTLTDDSPITRGSYQTTTYESYTLTNQTNTPKNNPPIEMKTFKKAHWKTWLVATVTEAQEILRTKWQFKRYKYYKMQSLHAKKRDFPVKRNINMYK